MLRRIILLLNFYSLFAAATLCITAACAVLLYQLGIKPFVYIFWFKMISTAVCIYGAYWNKGNLYYYYKNLGISVRALWIGAFLLDFVIFTGVVVFTYQIKVL